MVSETEIFVNEELYMTFNDKNDRNLLVLWIPIC
jgi:hypothetical protein